MKKHWASAALAAVLAAAMLTGCGGKDEALPDTGSAPAEERAQLSTDGDTFHLNMLSNLIQTSDIGVCELLGDGEEQTYDAQGDLATRSYSGVLFGQEVTYVVSYQLNDVTGITLTFDGTSASPEDLADAMTEELGKEPSDDGYLWKTDNSRVRLTEQDGVPTVTLEPYSGQ